jgi:hypothetical protein
LFHRCVFMFISCNGAAQPVTRTPHFHVRIYVYSVYKRRHTIVIMREWHGVCVWVRL